MLCKLVFGIWGVLVHGCDHNKSNIEEATDSIQDMDGDGYDSNVDCDDNNPNIVGRL